jgi:hypothetical protein
MRAMPKPRELYPGIRLKTEEKARKTLRGKSTEKPQLSQCFLPFSKFLQFFTGCIEVWTGWNWSNDTPSVFFSFFKSVMKPYKFFVLSNAAIPLPRYEYMNTLNVARQHLIFVNLQYATFVLSLVWFQ